MSRLYSGDVNDAGHDNKNEATTNVRAKSEAIDRAAVRVYRVYQRERATPRKPGPMSFFRTATRPPPCPHSTLPWRWRGGAVEHDSGHQCGVGQLVVPQHGARTALGRVETRRA